MKIFYIDINELKKIYNREFFEKYAEKSYKSETHFYQHTTGRFLLKNAAKKFFSINNTEITTDETGKPNFKHSDLNFSISHSKDIAIVCFSVFPCGIDIEYQKERNFSRFGEYYGEKFNTKEEFYIYWTQKEALYKAGKGNFEIPTFKFFNDYYICVATKEHISKNDLLAENFLTGEQIRLTE